MNLGKWDRWFSLVKDPEPFGLSITYDLAADWLKDCATVEDWGCGKGWFSQYFDEGYVGVDGSKSPFVDVVADLAEYRSGAEGICLRHVLEHDYRWPLILNNAVASTWHRLVIILFTPLSDERYTITVSAELGVPDISFALENITRHLQGFSWTAETMETPTQYGVETIIRAERA